MIRVAVLTATLLTATPVLAAGDLAYTPPAPVTPPDGTGLLLRLVGLTALVLVVCGGLIWAARTMQRTARPKAGDAGRLRHEGSLTLDRRCAVHLIRADGQTVAITVDATGLRSMVVLSEPFDAVLDEAVSTSPTE